ncbi:hypothetical protein VTJ49DRAFT_5686 [Mycothermus thermophilus]|uniref:LIM zinc-binding domain-containing protein n=1 Tax=Humicola insolens TaxID=85995 RepID=A0ABR3V3K1_HUMIN
MAAVGRESRFMPMVKCSTCGEQVEISLMGEHTCGGSGSAPEPTPPLPAASLFGRLMTNMPSFGNPLAPKEQPRTAPPPQVDTSAANRSFASQGQETPVSVSSGSQNSISPLTPNGGPGSGDADDYAAPRIARPDNAAPSANPPKPGLSLKDRLDAMSNMSGPFDPFRRPSTSSRTGPADLNERPGTSASNISSSSFGPPKMPRAPNGYGGFGAPTKASANTDEPPLTPNRAETFPRLSDRFAPPQRTPSAPLRAESLQPPMGPQSPANERPPTASESSRRPSRGPDTSRPPPPRGPSMMRPTTPNVPVINLAEEFGIGNPYHTSSESTSSSNSVNSSQPERRPSQASQASSRTSPPRSLSSRSGKGPSFDSMVSDTQSSVDGMRPKPPTVAPLKIIPRDKIGKPPPPERRPPREGGYDPRIDPRVQSSLDKGRSPIPPPTPISPRTPQDAFWGQRPNNILSPSATEPLPSPRWARSPDRADERLQPPPDELRPPPQNQPQPPRQLPPGFEEPREPRARPPAHTRSQSQPKGPTAPSSRGSCRACGDPITGKSISSADGRLTGRYHKACFVCTTCKEPFPTATFYVLNDRPYCELHYHKLNGSLCGSCGRGIEGQYLEDTSSGVKHHVGCFKCGECGMALRDGYFEVDGKAYCEKDAWRLVGRGNNYPGPPGPPGGHGGLRPPYMGLPGGPRPETGRDT